MAAPILEGYAPMRMTTEPHNMPRLLGIQFRIDEALAARERTAIARSVGEECTVDFVSALDDALPWGSPAEILSGIAGVILGGSGDLDFDGGRTDDDPVRLMSREVLERLRLVFSYIFEHDIPTLGICYGHQILGAFAGASVVHDTEQSKVGTHPARLMVDTNDYFLFSELPEEFFAQYGHKDVLDRVPDGATLLLQGERCKVAGLRYKGNIYTVQFHPELTAEDMIDRFNNSPGYLPEGAVVADIVKPSPHAGTILRNFAKMAVARMEGQ